MRSSSERPSLCRMAVPVRQLWHPVSAIASVVVFFWPVVNLYSQAVGSPRNSSPLSA